MSLEPALSTMSDAVALWYVGAGSAAGIVRAACELLVAGADGPSLCALAAVSFRHADEEVPELLEAAMQEVGLAFHPRGTIAAHEAGIRVMASRVLTGDLTPKALAVWAWSTFPMAPVELPRELKLLGFDYEYLDEYAEVGVTLERSAEQLDAEIVAEARRIVASGRR
ncbi:hypothetical protein [Lentzea sp. CC55]|uniref:hypothetical protein n=1 Tax=Lentzea sp. CC55 TaxID=2884909 RepID=UPI001F1AC8F7|nr:hypothetical protein [Lentzea sp. CC55]MCG8924687.1 hypothetical protein [Lentzea sp. CC55]